jgi:hypothetical protein
MNTAGEFKAAQGPRHVHIGEENLHVASRLQLAKRLVGTCGFDHLEAGRLKKIGSEQPNQHLVLDEENHGALT